VRGSSRRRTPIKVPLPVVTGRPRLFVLALIDLVMNRCYHKIKSGG
jgi:hypothetical protein